MVYVSFENRLAEATGFRSNRQQRDPIRWAISLDTPLSDEADSDDLIDVLVDPSGQKGLESAEEAIYQKQLQETVDAALSTLPEQYREVLCLRYWEDRTLENIGDLCGVGKERIRQIESKAIRQLRKPSIACHLRPFYDFDVYCGTGLGAFQRTGMSIQEHYLIREEERQKRAQERERQRQSQDRIQREFAETMERIEAEVADRVNKMSAGEKERLLRQAGYL